MVLCISSLWHKVVWNESLRSKVSVREVGRPATRDRCQNRLQRFSSKWKKEKLLVGDTSVMPVSLPPRLERKEPLQEQPQSAEDGYGT